MSMGFVAELLIAYHDPVVSPYSIAQRTALAERDDAPAPDSNTEEF